MPAFSRLAVSYTLNYLGDHAGLVALAILVYGETGDALATSALFIAAQFVPAFAAPALTARVDQINVRRALPALYLAEGAIFAALALLSSAFVLWIVLALAVCDGVLMLTARALTRSTVNAIMEPQRMLREANGVLNIGFALAGVLGAALGGGLVDAFGVSAALYADAASFVVIALLVATCRSLPSAAGERTPFLARLRAGLVYARSDRRLRLLLSGEGAAVFLFTLIVPIEVVYAKETLQTGDAGFGLLLSSWGAGVVLGSIVFAAARRSRSWLQIFVSTALIGAAYLGMAWTDDLAVACAFSVVGGAGNGVQWVAVMTSVQEATPGDLQARVTGLLESIAAAATGAGFLVGGILTAIASPPTTFLIAGAGIWLLVVGSLPALRSPRLSAVGSKT